MKRMKKRTMKEMVELIVTLQEYHYLTMYGGYVSRIIEGSGSTSDDLRVGRKECLRDCRVSVKGDARIQSLNEG